MLTIALDLNHWIGLARTFHGLPHGASPETLQRLLSAVRSKKARVPISFLNLVELLRQSNRDRRGRLAEFLDLLADGWCMAYQTYVLPQEIERALAMSLNSTPAEPPEVIGRGYLFGLDDSSRQHLSEMLQPGRFELLEHLASLPGAVLDLIVDTKESDRLKQNASIGERNRADATAADELRMKLRGEDPDLLERLWFAHYTLKHQDVLARALARRGLSLQDFYDRGERVVREFWSNVPSLDVEMHLNLYRDRQWTRPVEPNDFADIGQLVLGIPYCSIVVTERFWTHAAQRTNLTKRYGAKVLASLEDLAGEF